MDYSFCKLINDEDYVDITTIMSGFDCMCSLMTKVDMMGDNLVDGEYVVTGYDAEDDEGWIEIVIVVKDDCIHVVDPDDYFD